MITTSALQRVARRGLPSELPAIDLPDYEPSLADLAACESLTDIDLDELIASTNTSCAYAAGREARRLARADRGAGALAIGEGCAA